MKAKKLSISRCSRESLGAGPDHFGICIRFGTFPIYGNYTVRPGDADMYQVRISVEDNVLMPKCNPLRIGATKQQ